MRCFVDVRWWLLGAAFAAAGGCGFTVLDPPASFVALAIDVTSRDEREASVMIHAALDAGEEESVGSAALLLGDLRMLPAEDLTYDTTFSGLDVDIARAALRSGQWTLPVVTGVSSPVAEPHVIVERSGTDSLVWSVDEPLVLRFIGGDSDDLNWSLALVSVISGVPTIWGLKGGTGSLNDSIVVEPTLFRCGLQQPLASLMASRSSTAENASGNYVVGLSVISGIDWYLEMRGCP